jgi:hypothetical protein
MRMQKRYSRYANYKINKSEKTRFPSLTISRQYLHDY